MVDASGKTMTKIMYKFPSGDTRTFKDFFELKVVFVLLNLIVFERDFFYKLEFIS